MHLGTSSIIAIAELVVYIPAIILAFFVCARHSFSRSSGWYYTFTLCLIRIVGAVCQLLTLADTTSVGLVKAVLVLNHIGLTPLLLSTLGMLSRIVDWINARSSSPLLSVTHFRLAQLFVVLGAVFGIIGAVNSGSSSNGSNNSDIDPSSPSVWSHVAVICYVVTYAMLVYMIFRSLPFVQMIPPQERILVPAIGLALPLVFVRLLYQVLIVFVHRGTFSRLNGPILVQVLMSLVVEFLVVTIFLLVGLKLDRLEESEQGPILSRPWKNRDKRRRKHRQGVYSESAAPITGGHEMGPGAYMGRGV
ncbi:conserved hypothetical protein [Talaromyces stipitatus ATCC 10500]|uniref:DUF7702 domain-containing protein n=1 Tax=Talaromyces stipitatus (strain ATCC 10500 / CBS 375.48 / QM 6759 / NRRL 1006) TaxID=441959 RepID=B8MJD9_TALSN|nr:uncharacterized protein TSTA_042030 [Talaromyces stipitatus ATCC 10500]EED14728.1 conserved hypothetical protein [Talaromyces stipitatus ATCC 10500]